jgi:hypothetical protein
MNLIVLECSVERFTQKSSTVILAVFNNFWILSPVIGMSSFSRIREIDIAVKGDEMIGKWESYKGFDQRSESMKKYPSLNDISGYVTASDQ